MRKRNQEFASNIGELTEEISRQDMELVNGGKCDVRVTNSSVVEGLFTLRLGCEQNMPVTKDNRCYNGLLTEGNQ